MGYPQKFNNKREMLGQFREYATFLRSLLLDTAGNHIELKLKLKLRRKCITLNINKTITISNGTLNIYIGIRGWGKTEDKTKQRNHRI